jgi:hypothetical protein
MLFSPMSNRLRRLIAGVLFASSVPLAASPASAQDRSWSNTDIALGVASAALHIADWSQTRVISKNPDRWYETNRFLGANPSLSEVNAYFLAYGAATAALAHFFPEYRRVILAVHIGMHAQGVASNYSIGIKVNW